MKINTLKRSILVALISLTFCLKAEDKIGVFGQQELKGFLNDKTTVIYHATCSKNGTTESSIFKTGKNSDQEISDVCPQLGNEDNTRIVVTGYTENQNNLQEADEKGCESVAGIELDEEYIMYELKIKPFIKGRGVFIIFYGVFEGERGNFENSGHYIYYTKDNYKKKEEYFRLKNNRDLVLLLDGTYTDYLSIDFIYICIRLIIKYTAMLQKNREDRSVDKSLVSQRFEKASHELVQQYVEIVSGIHGENSSTYFLAFTIIKGIVRFMAWRFNESLISKVTFNDALIDKFVTKNNYLIENDKKKVETQLISVANTLKEIFCHYKLPNWLYSFYKNTEYIYKKKMGIICKKLEGLESLSNPYNWGFGKRNKRKINLVLHMLTNLYQSFENTAFFTEIFNKKLSALQTDEHWSNVVKWEESELREKDKKSESAEKDKKCIFPVVGREEKEVCIDLNTYHCNIFDFMINSADKYPYKKSRHLCLEIFHFEINRMPDTDMSSYYIERNLKKILEYAKSEIEKPENKRDYPTTPLGLQELLSTDTASVVPNNNEGSNESNNNSIINKPLNLLRIIL